MILLYCSTERRELEKSCLRSPCTPAPTGQKSPLFHKNCAAIPESLLEAIFFGVEKGSFTGAENRKGLFELADGGTLFLDEINSMDISMQAKLLKAIEEQQVRRIGSAKSTSLMPGSSVP